MIFNRDDESVLFVSAHPDDSEIFAGGTIAKLVADDIDVHVLLLSQGSKGGKDEVRVNEFRDAVLSLGVPEPNIWYKDFPDTVFYNNEAEIVGAIEFVIKKMQIQTVFTHHPFDTHQDHRVTANATLAAARNIKNVLFYCPSWPSGRTSVPFHNDFIVKLSQDNVEAKIKALYCYKSQIKKYGADDYVGTHRAILKANSLTLTGDVKGNAEVFEINRVVYE